MLVILKIVKVQAQGSDLSDGMIQFRINFILGSVAEGPDSDLNSLAKIARAFAETAFYQVGQSYPQIYHDVMKKGHELIPHTPYMLIMNGLPKNPGPKLCEFCRPLSGKNENAIVVPRSLFMERVITEEEEIRSGMVTGEEY